MRPRDTDLIDGLTPKQLQVLRHIAAFHGSQCYSPTIAELATQLSLSPSTVFEHLGELQRRSLLTTSPGRARSLELTSQGRRLLKDSQPQGGENEEEPRADIPLLGRVAAGLPVEAVENKEDLSLRSCFGTGDDLFALQARGDGMIEEGICSGDYVICRRAQRAANGTLVVALVHEDGTRLKRFYKERDKARLQPANPNYEPIYSDRQ